MSRESIRYHRIDRGVSSGEKIDASASVRRLYQLLAKMKEVGVFSPESLLRMFSDEDPQQEQKVRIIESVLLAHLIQEEWEYFIQQPIPRGEDMTQDRFFWTDFVITLNNALLIAQQDYESGQNAQQVPLTVQALRTFAETFHPQDQGDFVKYFDFLLIVKQLYEMIEVKFLEEEKRPISAEEFYKAATHQDFVSFLLGWMYNDSPTGMGLWNASMSTPYNSPDFRIDSSMKPGVLERDPETNVVRYSSEHVRHVQSLIAQGVIVPTEMQVSCPVAHAGMLKDMTKWLARVATHYRFQAPLPDAIAIEAQSVPLEDMLRGSYGKNLSEEYKKARHITN
jgi:hypothetical protein